MHKHVAIWIDGKEARVYNIDAEKIHEATVSSSLQHATHHRHPKGPGEAKQHPDDMKKFFHEVVKSIAGAQEILIVGPAATKLEFLRFLHKHDAAMETKIVGIETVDHPSDNQLVAYAKKYFHRTDRMLPVSDSHA